MWFYLIVSRAAGRKDRISLQKWGTHQSRVERASLIAQLVKNPPAMQETPVQFLGQEDPLEKGKATHSSILGLPLWLSCWRICVQCGRPGFNPWFGKIPWRREKATDSSILVWIIPWAEKPGRQQFMGLQRVRHNWVTELTNYGKVTWEV